LADWLPNQFGQNKLADVKFALTISQPPMHHWCILDCVISPLLLQAMFHLLHHKGVAEEIGILHETVIHVTWLAPS